MIDLLQALAAADLPEEDALDSHFTSAELSDVEQNATHSPYAGLPSKMIAALLALLDQGIKESKASIAQRAGVSRSTLWRYEQDPSFMEIFNQEKRRLISSRMPQYINALHNVALDDRKPGQVAAIRTLFEADGLIKAKSGEPVVINNNVNGFNVNGANTIPLESIPTWLKVIIIQTIQTGKRISPELETRIITELSDCVTLDVQSRLLSTSEEDEPIRLISATDYGEDEREQDYEDDSFEDDSEMLF